MVAASVSVCTNQLWSVDLEGFSLHVSSVSSGNCTISTYFSTSGFPELLQWGVFNGDISFGLCAALSLSLLPSLPPSSSPLSLCVSVCLFHCLSACIMSDCGVLHLLTSDTGETFSDGWIRHWPMSRAEYHKRELFCSLYSFVYLFLDL